MSEKKQRQHKATPANDMLLKVVGRIHTDFPVKFGIPRQSGLANTLEGEIVFEPEFRNPDLVRGLSEVSHIWLLWGFSEVQRDKWTATVRPPRLGGNKRLGVFATRSPYRPNPIGLSCVELSGVEIDEKRGPIVKVRGADLLDGTPIYDIKPYITYADARPEANSGIFTCPDSRIAVEIPEGELAKVAEGKRQALIEILEQNPVPAYQHEKDKTYSFEFSDYHIEFKQEEGKLKVIKIGES